MPSPPHLFHISNNFTVNMSLPYLYLASPDLSPTLFRYMLDVQGEWPPTLVGVLSLLF